MRSIYRQIAKRHGVSVEEVKRDMQAAIDHAYRNTPPDGVTAAYQAQIPHRGETPTAREIVRFAVQRSPPERAQTKKSDKGKEPRFGGSFFAFDVVLCCTSPHRLI